MCLIIQERHSHRRTKNYVLSYFKVSGKMRNSNYNVLGRRFNLIVEINTGVWL